MTEASRPALNMAQLRSLTDLAQKGLVAWLREPGVKFIDLAEHAQALHDAQVLVQRVAEPPPQKEG